LFFRTTLFFRTSSSPHRILEPGCWASASGCANAGELAVTFDSRSVTYPFGELDMLVPAYAATIHKSRGSEYPVLESMRQPQTTLWRRQMVLGPGREFALIVPLGLDAAAPSGWSALAIERVRVDASH
jgi:hypothetical protein